MNHDDARGPRENTAKPYRKGALAKHKRTQLSHCDVGDYVVYGDGQMAVVTSELSGRIFGRYIDATGLEGQFQSLPDGPIRIVRTLR